MRAVWQPSSLLPFSRIPGDAIAHLVRSLRSAVQRSLRGRTFGRVSIVGAGPGDPELLTVRALRCLRAADVVAYDHLVGPEILAMVPAHARKICVGKRAGYHSMPQGEINALLVGLAIRYRRVVRLKGGDPGLFARTGEEIVALERAGIQYDIVPGITAAFGCAASVGMPLTQRGVAHSVHFVAGHLCGDDAQVDWARMTDPEETLVLYMARSTLGNHAKELIAHGLCAQTPVLVIFDGTLPTQSTQKLTLADCAAGLVSGMSGAPALVVIGQVAKFAKRDHGSVTWSEASGVAARRR